MYNSSQQLDSFDGFGRLIQLLEIGNIFVEQRDRQGNWQTLFRLRYKKKRDRNAIAANDEQPPSLPKLAGTPM